MFRKARYYGSLSLIASLAVVVFYSIPDCDGALRVSMFASFGFAALTVGELAMLELLEEAKK